MPHSRYHNHILTALSKVLDVTQLPSMEHVDVAEGEVLQEPSVPPSWVYFPQTAQLSLQLQDPSGECTELALLGNTCAAGLPELGTSAETLHRCVVVYGGTAWRISAEVLLQQAQSNMALWRTLMLCNEYTTQLIARTALCNTRHSVVQSLCRNLLLIHDQAADAPLVLSKRMVRQMRAAPERALDNSVAELAQARAIAVHAEHIAVVDRQALMRCSCDCYAVIQQSNETLFRSLLGG